MKTSFSKGRENKFYIGIVATIGVLMVVFFTSKIWLYDDSAVMQTPFNSEITGLDQTTLMLEKWEYNPEIELMEVTLGTNHTGNDVVKPTFSFTAKEKDSADEYTVKVVYQDDEHIIVQIKNVPEKYRVVGLFVYEHRDAKVLEAELKEQELNHSGSLDQDGEEIKLSLPKPSQKVIVGDYRKIKENKKLVTKDVIDYQIENIERQIVGVEKEMKYILEEKIVLEEQLIKELQKQIDAIEEDLEYQTEEEKEESLLDIQSKKSSIDGHEATIEELQLDVQKLLDKRLKLQQKLESLHSDSDEETEQKDADGEKKKEEKKQKDTDKKTEEKEEKEGKDKASKKEKGD